MKIRILLIGILFYSSYSFSMPRPETLNSILEKANVNSLTVKRADSKVAEALDQLDLAHSNYYPNLSLLSSGWSNQFLLNQKIYDGGYTLAYVDLSHSQKKAAEWNKRREAESLRDRVIQAYYEGLLAIQQLEIVEENSKLIKRAMEAAQKQLKFRAIGRDVYFRVLVEDRKARVNLLEAKNYYQLAERRISLVIYDSSFSLKSLKERMEFEQLPRPMAKERAEEVEKKYENSPNIQWLRSNEGVLNAQRDIDLSLDRPQLSVQASYGANKDGPPQTVNYVYKEGFNVGLQLTLPIFSGFSSSARKAIYNEKKFQLNQDIEAEKTNFSFEIRRHLDNLNQNWSDLASIQKEIEASEDVFNEINKTYHYGLSSPELWFQARAAVEAWRLRELQKLRDYLIGYKKVTDLSML